MSILLGFAFCFFTCFTCGGRACSVTGSRFHFLPVGVVGNPDSKREMHASKDYRSRWLFWSFLLRR